MAGVSSDTGGGMNRCRMWLVVWVFSAVCCAGGVWAGPEVIASGLFKNKAMLTINGNTRLLKAGETSLEGVQLLSSNSKQAVVVIDGESLTLKLSQRISSSFSEAKLVEVKLPRRANGHFYARGAINGYPTEFMVDTGATAIAMNLSDAKRLGIDIKKGIVSGASTAGGNVKTYVVTLAKVSVGGITVHNIRATVIDGTHPEDILLGNTFLSRVEMSEQAGVLVLRKKF